MRRATPLVILALLAMPASALAADTYVDQGSGLDASNSCTDPTAPCKTLTKGIAQAGANDTVFVGGGETYAVTQTLDSGKSLIEDDFSTTPDVDTSGVATIDTGSTVAPAITVTGPVSTVSGFTIRSDQLGVEVTGLGDTIEDNRFEGTAFPDLLIDVAGAGAVVSGNRFNAASTSHNFAIADYSEGPTGIEANTMTGYGIGMVLTGSELVMGNRILEVGDPFESSTGILLSSNYASRLEDNVVKAAPGVGSDAVGIQILSSGRANLSRNLVSGFSTAGIFSASSSTVSLNDNAITKVPKGAIGLHTLGKAALGQGDVIAQGLTISGKGTSIFNQKADLTLSSSLLDTKPIDTKGKGTRCHISYSRGPVKKPGGNGCKDFDTTKNPKLKGDGYHLKGSSPMIDRGKPAAPPHGATDIDGDKRALAGDCSVHHPKKRRDIGADEFKCA
jgi:parallel beta helix pectate lyase-like protein